MFLYVMLLIGDFINKKIFKFDYLSSIICIQVLGPFVITADFVCKIGNLCKKMELASLLFWLFAAVCVLYCVLCSSSWFKRLKIYSKIPFPKSQYFIGNVVDLQSGKICNYKYSSGVNVKCSWKLNLEKKSTKKYIGVKIHGNKLFLAVGICFKPKL